jgi:hypothetical protein
VSTSELPDVPLDQPLRAPARRFARPDSVAPAPRWVAPLYLALSLLLIPWIVYLGFAPPAQFGVGDWRFAWIGFDAMEAVALAVTAWLAYRRSTWVDMAATATAVLLIVDAWFDITTANGGWPLVEAVGAAVLLELPLAALSLWVARNAQIVNEAVTRWLIDRSTLQAAGLRRATEMGVVTPAGVDLTPAEFDPRRAPSAVSD